MCLVQTQPLEEGSNQSFSTFHLPKKNPRSCPCATLPCLSPSSSFSLRSKAPCHSCPNIHTELVITVVLGLGWIVAQNNLWGSHKMAWSKPKEATTLCFQIACRIVWAVAEMFRGDSVSHDNCRSYFKCLVSGQMILKKAPYCVSQPPPYTLKHWLLLKFRLSFAFVSS